MAESGAWWQQVAECGGGWQKGVTRVLGLFFYGDSRLYWLTFLESHCKYGENNCTFVFLLQTKILIEPIFKRVDVGFYENLQMVSFHWIFHRTIEKYFIIR